MDRKDTGVVIETGQTPTIIRYNPGVHVSRRDFLMAGALISAGVLGVGEARAQAPAPGAAKPVAPMMPVTDKERAYMKQAIDEMRRAGVVDKTGGPFGAVIVLDGQIIASTGNSVLKDMDPSAHAEVNAIRQACRKLKTLDLHGATLYTSCECCPMCYATAYWARIGKIFYAAAWQDYDDIFDDAKIGVDMAKPYSERLLAPQQIMQAEGQQVWKEYRAMPSTTRY